jgi:hypothetical protein
VDEGPGNMVQSMHPHNPELRDQTPVYIDIGVLVGYWYVCADGSGNGRRPVYCIVKDGSFEYACLVDGVQELVRWFGFDPPPGFSP